MFVQVPLSLATSVVREVAREASELRNVVTPSQVVFEKVYLGSMPKSWATENIEPEGNAQWGTEPEGNAQ